MLPPSRRRRLYGHLHTLGPVIQDAVVRRSAPRARFWTTPVADPQLGEVPLTGRFTEVSTDGTVLVLLHGLGGSHESVYMRHTAGLAHGIGLSCLRVANRGADGEGADLYHAGLVGDLHAILASAALRPYRRICVLGFSMGGHVALRGAADPALDSRVVRVAAVCPPLDLAANSHWLDRPQGRIYQRSVMGGLKELYRQVAARGRAPTPWAVVKRARTLVQWDELAVVPRFGYASLEDYYAREHAGQFLDRLVRPTLIVSSDQDPMIPITTVDRMIGRGHPDLEYRRVCAGGHVGFSGRHDLGLGHRGHPFEQVLRWLAQ